MKDRNGWSGFSRNQHCPYLSRSSGIFIVSGSKPRRKNPCGEFWTVMDCEVWLSENHIISSELCTFMNECFTKQKQEFPVNCFHSQFFYQDNLKFEHPSFMSLSWGFPESSLYATRLLVATWFTSW
jgi:hypothetical protein